MIRYFTLWVALLTPLLAGACKAEGEHIEIGVSETCKRQITEAAPRSEYTFLALKEKAPADFNDLRDRDLVVCGSMRSIQFVKLYAASLSDYDVPLFRSFHHYFIKRLIIEIHHRSSWQVLLIYVGGRRVGLLRDDRHHHRPVGPAQRGATYSLAETIVVTKP